MKFVFNTLVLGTLIIFGSLSSSAYIFAHDFSPDESANFLTFIDELNTEVSLTSSSLQNNDFNSAQIHAKLANSLYTDDLRKEIEEQNKRVANDLVISLATLENMTNANDTSQVNQISKDILDITTEAISVRIDPEDLKNTTIHALHFANLINLIDKKYATALGEEPMQMSNSLHASSNSHEMKNTSHNNMSSNNNTITDFTSYQSAKALNMVAEKLYNDSIKHFIPSNSTKPASELENGLKELKHIIENKLPYDQLMGIIHGNIQTYMLDTFHLNVESKTNMTTTTSGEHTSHQE